MGGQISVAAQVVFRHTPGTEPSFELKSHPRAFQAADAVYGIDRLVVSIHDEACFAFRYDLGNRATRQRDYRCSAGHCLDHHEFEWLRPVDGKEQSLGASEKRCLVFVIDFPDELHVMFVYKGLNLFSEELPFPAGYLGGDLSFSPAARAHRIATWGPFSGVMRPKNAR